MTPYSFLVFKTHSLMKGVNTMMFHFLGILLWYCAIGWIVVFVSSAIMGAIVTMINLHRMEAKGEDVVTITRKLDEARLASKNAVSCATKSDLILGKVYSMNSMALSTIVETLLWPTVFIIIVCEYPKAFKKSILESA